MLSNLLESRLCSIPNLGFSCRFCLNPCLGIQTWGLSIIYIGLNHQEIPRMANPKIEVRMGPHQWIFWSADWALIIGNGGHDWWLVGWRVMFRIKHSIGALIHAGSSGYFSKCQTPRQHGFASEEANKWIKIGPPILRNMMSHKWIDVEFADRGVRCSMIFICRFVQFKLRTVEIASGMTIRLWGSVRCPGHPCSFSWPCQRKPRDSFTQLSPDWHNWFKQKCAGRWSEPRFPDYLSPLNQSIEIGVSYGNLADVCLKF